MNFSADMLIQQLILFLTEKVKKILFIEKFKKLPVMVPEFKIEQKNLTVG